MASNNYPKGAKQNPYSMSTYDYMIINNIWFGGWVIESNYSKYYINGYRQTIYGGNDLGTELFPYPDTIYQEMISNRNWTGGWVINGDGDIIYEESMFLPVEENGSSSSSGSGSGSGSYDENDNQNNSGCGCGCGCGCDDFYIDIYSGSMIEIEFDDETCIAFKVKYTWTTGRYNTTDGDCSSTISAEVLEVAYYGNKRVTNFVRGRASWDNAFTIRYTIKYQCCDISDPQKVQSCVISGPVLRDDIGC